MILFFTVTASLRKGSPSATLLPLIPRILLAAVHALSVAPDEPPPPSSLSEPLRYKTTIDLTY